jgi:chromosome segregation ATPase
LYRCVEARTQVASLEQAKEKLEERLDTANSQHTKHQVESENLRSKLRGVEAKLQQTHDWLDRARAEQAGAELETESARKEAREKLEAANHAAEATRNDAKRQRLDHRRRVDAVMDAAEARNALTVKERDEALAAAVVGLYKLHPVDP